MSILKASVIISTYNQPEWLEKVLWGYEVQTETNFEIVIADDGSGQSTKQLIDRFIQHTKLKIIHVWQEDDGFQKTKILNKAILKTASDYLIFTDGDCIPRNDFVETHLALRKPNTFLSGGYFKLPQGISKAISKEDIENQNCFQLKWLLEHGLKKTFKTNKLTASGIKARLLNTFTPTKATFDGMNVSGWKQHIIDVNGFDERMQYGGEDREIGERLMNCGIAFKQIRYSAICVHLHHDRPYKNEEALNKNQAIRKVTKTKKSKTTKFGITKHI
ncbi:glycosyltransferase family 2 protein [Aestuariibaculum suncheonense]|uniref:Glycosyltransferase family 2 protein n=1 Tax=Aestuariibaculum suncheonense TaxID=1028745 RepID=A0A8J6QG30_9FLAO|nr:glycosyltransferase family 2 protein [Aestuariibaculum suncheonense]MBD0834921.1 glycosyltransferase family 2 protein [Aestuariibaculum suncheonense]